MSELRADTITASDGTSPVTLTKQSAAKAWVNFNGEGTIAARDSLNHSGLTDNGTGDYTVTLTNSFNYSNSYIVISGTIGEIGSLNRGVSSAMLFTSAIGGGGTPSGQTASSYRLRYAYGSSGSANGSESDNAVIHSMAHGDLA